MSPADPAVAGVRDAGEGLPLLPAAGLHPRGLHSPPRPGTVQYSTVQYSTVQYIHVVYTRHPVQVRPEQTSDQSHASDV